MEYGEVQGRGLRQMQTTLAQIEAKYGRGAEPAQPVSHEDFRTLVNVLRLLLEHVGPVDEAQS